VQAFDRAVDVVAADRQEARRPQLGGRPRP
jgi:hypothetical protein